MTSAEEYLSKANDEYKKGEEYKELANKHFNNYAELIAIYRIESVNRVLDFISMATDREGNLMFFDTATYNRSKGKEFDGFRVNINDLVK